jgi:hypothetical protein
VFVFFSPREMGVGLVFLLQTTRQGLIFPTARALLRCSSRSGFSFCAGSRPGFCRKFSLPGNQFTCCSVLLQPACSAPPVFRLARRAKRPGRAPGIFQFPPLFWSRAAGSVFSLAFQAPVSVSHPRELRSLVPRSCTNLLPLFNLVNVGFFYLLN